jgi:hypothetical protein
MAGFKHKPIYRFHCEVLDMTIHVCHFKAVSKRKRKQAVAKSTTLRDYLKNCDEEDLILADFNMKAQTSTTTSARSVTITTTSSELAQVVEGTDFDLGLAFDANTMIVTTPPMKGNNDNLLYHNASLWRTDKRLPILDGNARWIDFTKNKNRGRQEEGFNWTYGDPLFGTSQQQQ